MMPLLLLHYISSESMQIMRIIVYLLPIFYLLTCSGLDKLIKSFKKNKIAYSIGFIIGIIVLAFITAPFWIYHIIEPSDYIDEEQPCIPNYMGGCD